tara:strand:- start:24 stop:956 length:933 start_codon:yes stop_codon:yes gene_type:complete
MINYLVKILRNILGINNLTQELTEVKMQNAKILINQIKRMKKPTNLSEIEFKIFSQFGDDGIIQYIINNLNIEKKNKTFIEFGVENYQESNTRFLLMNDNWDGLIMDGSKKNIEYVKNQPHYWQHKILALSEFINIKNINNLIKDNGFSGEIGLLSIDLDGNDYWIWKEISTIKPIIIIAEYNGIFGNEFPLSIPYDENFIRSKTHYSNLYWGCSLRALDHIAKKKGYSFFGCNSSGNNAYFIRDDYLSGNISKISIDAGYVAPKFRESRNKNGKLSFLNEKERLAVIKNLPLTNVVTGETSTISEIFKL